MEDRFKFRAWYAKDKEMIYFDFDLLNEESRAFYKESIEKSDKMQSTGLKDKNGKLIYEGDVVRYQGRLWSVVYEEFGFYFKGKDQTRLSIRDAWLREYNNDEKGYEIKGNIYEHPELLTEEEE